MHPWRWLFVALLVATACTTATAEGESSATGGDGKVASPVTNVTPPPERRMQLGFYASARNGMSTAETNAQLIAELDRPIDLIRVYERWDSVFPRAYHEGLRDNGQTMLLSVRAKYKANGPGDGRDIPWLALASAPEGSELHAELVAWADALRDYDVPVYFIFHHEPEAKPSLGNGEATDFVAAWRTVVETFRDRNADNVEFVWNMTSAAFSAEDRRRAGDWYPGDDVVDHLGADPYNWYECRPGQEVAWRSLESMIQPFREFGADHPDKGLMLPEFGSDEDDTDPTRKADWLRDAGGLFAWPGYEQFVAVAYFHSDHDDRSSCDWWLTSTREATDAFRSIADLPVFARD